MCTHITITQEREKHAALTVVDAWQLIVARVNTVWTNQSLEARVPKNNVVWKESALGFLEVNCNTLSLDLFIYTDESADSREKGEHQPTNMDYDSNVGTQICKGNSTTQKTTINEVRVFYILMLCILSLLP